MMARDILQHSMITGKFSQMFLLEAVLSKLSFLKKIKLSGSDSLQLYVLTENHKTITLPLSVVLKNFSRFHSKYCVNTQEKE